jgi:hypothetical protein
MEEYYSLGVIPSKDPPMCTSAEMVGFAIGEFFQSVTGMQNA